MTEIPTNKPATKHELKTKETRARLMEAAEIIFVRDGYEGAELGEIAALAGRTKGAIYAQFKSKEDVFLALVEDQRRRFRAEMEEMLRGPSMVRDNLEALRQFFLQRSEDVAWSLLLLEYKLFSLRHPESKQRLKDYYTGFVPDRDERRYTEFLGPAKEGKDPVSRVAAVHALMPMVSALILESQLEMNIVDNAVVTNVTNRLFDALLDIPQE